MNRGESGVGFTGDALIGFGNGQVQWGYTQGMHVFCRHGIVVVNA